ncbi:outer membrane biogenesis protein BamB [Symmachiella dynata]|uniref:outer membrane protein assembly factor BamB family protein n=1 Tax=Symmachiella dynata TaxID=2527995 RepID=UPI001187E987|nr:PQQ-binding-like beta-propeller repeat protein [Symmachiella dynata]QDT46834.1 outer membrane biogenesis protein BamB [Symmachiella dynata]
MRVLVLTPILLSLCVAVASADTWLQFRGPNGAGRMPSTARLPEEIGPEKNVLWKTPLPPGHSSPVVTDDRIFVSGVRDGQLVTIGLDRQTGKQLWERVAPHDALEKIHAIGSHAQSSPASDGEIVVSFFGSAGLFAYDKDGEPLWHKPLGPFSNTFGAGSSPILYGDYVILNQDHDIDSALMIFNKTNGELVRRINRDDFPRSYSTPIIWEQDGKPQIVVSGTLRIVGYDLETGEEIWTVRELARISNTTPVIGSDGVLYLAVWSPGADSENRIQAEPFDELIETLDKNKNGTLELVEIPEGALQRRFGQIDRNKSGEITRMEYEFMRNVFHSAENAIAAIRPGGTGDITDTHVLWKERKTLPYVPSPLFHDGHVYTVKKGGIFTSRDASTGQVVKTGRLPATGAYYSSPVYGDGKFYLLNQHGRLSVMTAQPKWKKLSTADFGEDAYATPALVDGKIYLRTAGHLYCFGLE